MWHESGLKTVDTGDMNLVTELLGADVVVLVPEHQCVCYGSVLGMFDTDDMNLVSGCSMPVTEIAPRVVGTVT